ncbi:MULTISPECIES: BlaI/MecI/CopY family transcriptional regulator [Paenibacillus]|uniref:Transcriptional regulator n=1 Tax=Paenibacillus azoreducens TaxID=116718 RepID=A0A919YCX1_9BACL|nr:MULTISPECIES: BlaI/MecI/CopY family transcriptional regulator [Paenibacillus]MBE9915296.1 BlaI/MecI/CopY family transcriptional regulator [Paenibacillus donghaensis]GIO48424.1 transcriptional regulator [Paenibacillus azoreducens]
MQITKAEMEIMKVLWESKRRMTTNEIMEYFPNKNKTTILTLAGRLQDKGALQSVKLGRSHAHEYWAAITEEDYRKMQTKSFLLSIHNGSAKSLISSLFQAGNLTKKDIEELRAFINSEADRDD